MATTLSISSTKALKGGANSGQRGYVGYYSSANWVMRYTITTPNAIVTSLTLRSTIYNTSSSALSSNPIRVKISSSTGYENAGSSSSYDGTMSYGTSGIYNAVCTINNLNLTPNTTYYVYQFPGTTSSHRHMLHDGNATTQTQITVETHTHSYTSSITKQPTCTAAGVRTYTCSCGSSYTESVAATGHSYSSTTIAATCTDGGYTKHTCSKCGNSYTDNAVAALGHSYNTTVINPTCTTAGHTKYTCSRCNDSYTDNTVAALGHSYNATVTNATCTENGYTKYTCSRCNDSYTDNHINATGHNFDGNTCLNCGQSLSYSKKQDCYVFNGTKWIKYNCYVGNKKMGTYIYKSSNPLTAALGSAILGTMKLGEGN